MPRIKLFLLLISLSCLSLHCKKESYSPKSELEQLPPITMEGKQTYGWLANGVAIIGHPYSFQAEYQNGVLSFGGRDDYKTPFFMYDANDFGIMVGNSLITGIGRYKIPVKYTPGNNTFFGAGINYPPYLGYGSDFTDHGFATINIYRLDTINFYMAGTFAFTVYSQFGDSLVITDGRFDFKYH